MFDFFVFPGPWTSQGRAACQDEQVVEGLRTRRLRGHVRNGAYLSGDNAVGPFKVFNGELFMERNH